jgi:hypothetical protein
MITTYFQGFRRVMDDMADICLDVPNAHSLLERLASKLNAQGVLSSTLMSEIPSK